MKPKYKLTLGLAVAVVLVVFVAFAVTGLASPSSTLTIQSANGAKHVFKVEVARTREEMAQGLMNRTELAADAGMVFLFEDEDYRSFWMKNTLIPLDIIFIGKDGTIRHIHPMALPLDETPVPSGAPAAAVLEINGGKTQALGIAVGDRVIYH
ncbi:MAG TPA: DUF192 domain-containing protein [Rhodospirillaceae bacterium]|nr:DUF192 domain-containing protein [Rhodospirillaceae bacterium]